MLGEFNQEYSHGTYDEIRLSHLYRAYFIHFDDVKHMMTGTGSFISRINYSNIICRFIYYEVYGSSG